jgi:hypothetical protein
MLMSVIIALDYGIPGHTSSSNDNRRKKIKVNVLCILSQLEILIEKSIKDEVITCTCHFIDRVIIEMLLLISIRMLR